MNTFLPSTDIRAIVLLFLLFIVVIVCVICAAIDADERNTQAVQSETHVNSITFHQINCNTDTGQCIEVQ